MQKIIVAAVAENGVIGNDGDIPWHYPEDMKHFRETTEGNPVLMGRKTYESLPEDYQPLPERKNIVLTRSGFKASENVKIAQNLKEAWKYAGKNSDKVFIIGGSNVYRQVISEADKMIITRIGERYEGDTYFPEWKRKNWREVNRKEKDKLSFVTLEKI